jgi:hypothetical protein
VVLDANAMSKKNWKRVAAGIWRNKSGTLYERPKVDGRWTYRSLETDDLVVAKTRFHRRRAGVEETPPTQTPQPPPARADEPETVLVGQVIQRYQQDGYRDRQRQQRPELTRTAEEGYCQMRLGFWERVPARDVTIATCDRYHTWRKERLTRGTGNRIVDLELNALNNAFLWACRCELVRDDPLAVRRPRYTSARNIQHCPKFMPANADELHHMARCVGPDLLTDGEEENRAAGAPPCDARPAARPSIGRPCSSFSLRRRFAVPEHTRKRPPRPDDPGSVGIRVAAESGFCLVYCHRFLLAFPAVTGLKEKTSMTAP